MDRINEVSKKYNLFVLEDVAQAFGGSWKNKKLGSLGTIGAFSFFPSKNLGGFGDGGMIATDDDKIADLTSMLSKHGGKNKYDVDHIGYNSRLDTIQAAILLAKLEYIDEFNKKRRKIAELYDEGLKNIKGIVLPRSEPDAYHVYHQYTIRVLDKKRDELQNYLKEKLVGTNVYYPVPLHKMKVFDGASKIHKTLGNAEKATEEVLSLPIEPLLNEECIQYVINSIKEFCNNKR